MTCPSRLSLSRAFRRNCWPVPPTTGRPLPPLGPSPPAAGWLRRCPPRGHALGRAPLHKGLNNRAENAHQPTRQREQAMKDFLSVGGAQRFLAEFSGIAPHFPTSPPQPVRYPLPSRDDHPLRPHGTTSPASPAYPQQPDPGRHPGRPHPSTLSGTHAPNNVTAPILGGRRTSRPVRIAVRRRPGGKAPAPPARSGREPVPVSGADTGYVSSTPPRPSGTRRIRLTVRCPGPSG
jgi:hypothetical protein